MARQLSDKNTLLFSTGGVPTAGDVITTNNDIIINPKTKSADYKDKGNGASGNDKTLSIPDWTTVDFPVDIIARASGTAGVAPKIAELFKACGLSETIAAGVSVTYAPAMNQATATAKAYLDGYMRDVTGIAGDLTISGKVGEQAKLSFSLKGFTTLDEAAEANPTVTLDQNTTLIIQSAQVITVGGSTINLESFDFSLGNEIEEVYAIGLKEYFVGGFKPTLKVKAVKTKGNSDHWNELKLNTKKEVIIVLGIGAGETLTLTASYCNPMEVAESADNKKIVYDRTWLCESSAGNDNFSLVYT